MEKRMTRPAGKDAGKLLALILAGCLLLSGSAAAGWGDLFTTQIEVGLEHPPDLGFTIDRVAFAEATGRCSGELVDALISEFVASGVEVIERERIEELLESIDFSASGYIAKKDAIALGQLLGPSALVFLDVQRCTEEQSRTTKTTQTKKGTYRTYYSTTTAYFKSSLRIVDIATGRIFSSKVVEETRQDTNSSRDGYPEYPSKYELHDAAIGGAVAQVRRLFFRWTEVLAMRFFKDDKCGLKDVYHLVRIGDYEGAVAQAEDHLAQCQAQPKVKPKLLARAHYNTGMSHFLVGELDGALGFFEQAYRVKPGSNMRQAVNTCKRAIGLAEEMSAFESRLARRQASGAGELLAAAESTTAAPESRSVAQRLKQLEELYKQGLLGEAEYREKRDEILADL